MTGSYNAAKQQFDEFCKARKITDFDSVVQVTHQDGCIFVLHNAALWRSKETTDGTEDGSPTWIGISTEHVGDMFFFTEDLSGWQVW